jgi:hypothetical protein
MGVFSFALMVIPIVVEPAYPYIRIIPQNGFILSILNSNQQGKYNLKWSIKTSNDSEVEG